MNKQGIRYCYNCKQRTPYNRYEAKEDSPMICLQCGKNTQEVSK